MSDQVTLPPTPPVANAYAFQEVNGTIDLDSVGETAEQVREKLLAAVMGWRFNHPTRYPHAVEWARLLSFGKVVPVSVTPRPDEPV